MHNYHTRSNCLPQATLYADYLYSFWSPHNVATYGAANGISAPQCPPGMTNPPASRQPVLVGPLHNTSHLERVHPAVHGAAGPI